MHKNMCYDSKGVCWLALEDCRAPHRTNHPIWTCPASVLHCKVSVELRGGFTFFGHWRSLARLISKSWEMGSTKLRKVAFL